MERLTKTAVAWTRVGQWKSWLAENHRQTAGLWLLIAKKGSTKVTITINQALDVALCYGWIDSQRKGFDDDYYLQRYSPRRAKSPWSKLNVERAEALISARRMRKPGLLAIADAKNDGRWAAAYASQRNAGLPPDFAAALKPDKRAKANFEQLNKSTQYAIILPLLKANSPARRLVCLQQAIDKLKAAGDYSH